MYIHNIYTYMYVYSYIRFTRKLGRVGKKNRNFISYTFLRFEKLKENSE